MNIKIKVKTPKYNKFFYKQVGTKHRWVDRLVWEYNKWFEYLNNSNVKTILCIIYFKYPGIARFHNQTLKVRFILKENSVHF